MSSRALKVAFLHLGLNEEMSPENTDKRPAEDKRTLDDNRLRQLVEDAVETYYRPNLEQYLRKLDVNELFSLAPYVVKHFNESEKPIQELNQSLLKFKKPLLRRIEEIAKSDDESLKGSIYKHFKEEPTENEDDITEFTQSWLRGIITKIKRNVPRVDKILK